MWPFKQKLENKEKAKSILKDEHFHFTIVCKANRKPEIYVNGKKFRRSFDSSVQFWLTVGERQVADYLREDKKSKKGGKRKCRKQALDKKK